MTLFLRPSKTTPLRQLVSHTVRRRGFATSPVTMAPGISDTIKRDHRQIESYYEKIIKSPEKDEQTRFQNLFTWELARLYIGEELIVYPLFERLLIDGCDMADKERKEHVKASQLLSDIDNNTDVIEQMKEHLKAFQTMTPSDTHFIPTIKELMESLSNHIKEEEIEDLPRLEEFLSQEDSESYAKCFGRTKMFVPSRSHPSAPDKPPYETAVGLLNAPIDHLADLFRSRWPGTSGMPNPSTQWSKAHESPADCT